MYQWEVVSDEATRGECFSLRASEYGKYYRNIAPDRFVDDFDEATDENGDPVSRLIAVRSGERVVGTCRLVLARHGDRTDVQSEIADLTDLCWRDFSIRIRVEPSSLVAGELGKFAVAHGSDVRRVKWLLLTATGQVAHRTGMQALIALMPPLVERAARHAGVSFRQFPTASLRRDSAQAQRLLLRYCDYFLPAFRKMNDVTDKNRDTLADLRAAYLDLFPRTPGRSDVLLFRIGRADHPTARSVRRPLADVLNIHAT